MKKVLLVVLVSLVVSAAALAAPNPASATAHCKKLLRTAPGAYPSLSACVTAQTAAAADAGEQRGQEVQGRARR